MRNPARSPWLSRWLHARMRGRRSNWDGEALRIGALRDAERRHLGIGPRLASPVGRDDHGSRDLPLASSYRSPSWSRDRTALHGCEGTWTTRRVTRAVWESTG